MLFRLKMELQLKQTVVTFALQLLQLNLQRLVGWTRTRRYFLYFIFLFLHSFILLHLLVTGPPTHSVGGPD